MNKIILTLALLLGVLSLSLPPASAQGGAPSLVTASAAARPAAMVRGGKGVLLVTLTVKPTYHINANKPNDPAYIPTVFTVQPTPGISFGSVRYPAAALVKVSYSPEPLLVYRGRVTLTVPFTVTSSVKPGVKLLTGSVSFQGCDAKSCYPPESALVKAKVTVK